jgi:UDP-glucose:(heptosyl)LPS alpha-1,3-glucosyltransferase
VIHNGVEWHEMQKPFDAWPEEKKRWLQQYNLPQDTLHLLFAGSGFRRKGLDLLLKALSLVHLPHLHLSIVGKDRKKGDYEALVAKLHLQSQVTFFGYQPSLLPFYQYSDILCIPSLYDPFANVTIEALAMGLFVISSKHNGGHEILNQNTGLILEENSIDAWAHALTTLSMQKQQERAIAARHSVAHLTFENQLQKLVQTTCKI